MDTKFPNLLETIKHKSVKLSKPVQETWRKLCQDILEASDLKTKGQLEKKIRYRGKKGIGFLLQTTQDRKHRGIIFAEREVFNLGY